jgi:aspartate ammonia-lyase
MPDFRMEHDLLGERPVPAESYYGIQTLRALDNYHITGIPISHYPNFIYSLAHIKKAAAQATSLGLLDRPHRNRGACDRSWTALPERVCGRRVRAAPASTT